MSAFCISCGNPMIVGAKYCGECGNPSGGAIAAPPVFIVAAPQNKSVAQKADEATEFVGRVGCNLLLGIVLFKIVVVVVVIVALWLFLGPVTRILFGH
jgi:hypothetical protein